MARITLLAVAILIGAGGCAGSAQPTASPNPSGTPGVQARIPVGRSPGSPAFGADALWVPNTADGTVSRIDPSRNKVVATIPIGDPKQLQEAGCGADSVHSFMRETFLQRRCDLPSAVAVGAGSVWVARNDQRALVRIDPSSNRVTNSIAVNAQPFEMAANARGVWLSDYLADNVVRVDPRTNRVAAVIGVDHGPSGIALADDAVWVVNTRAEKLTRIDPKNNRVVATIDVGAQPLPVAIVQNDVWVRNEQASTVMRIDPVRNQVVGSVRVAQHAGRDGGDEMAAVGPSLWVSGLYLARVDVLTGTVGKQLPQPGSSIAYGAGSLWVTDLVGTITRVSPS
jgi:YVTN family beta-propeller protein